MNSISVNSMGEKSVLSFLLMTVGTHLEKESDFPGETCLPGQ